jgi:hypothetical protein
VHHHVVRIGGKKFGETLVVREGRCCTFCVSDESEITGRTDCFSRWNSRESVRNDLWQANIQQLQKLVKVHSHRSRDIRLSVK